MAGRDLWEEGDDLQVDQGCDLLGLRRGDQRTNWNNLGIIVTLALGACTTTGADTNGDGVPGPLANGTGQTNTEQPPGTSISSGGQSGTEGAMACSCMLGESLEEVPLDRKDGPQYPLAYTPDEVLEMLVGTRTFLCPDGAEVVTEVVRGAGARLVEGERWSDTGGKDRYECRGLEIDALVTVRSSGGLEITGSKLRQGARCDGRFEPPVNVLTDIQRATQDGQPVDALVHLHASGVFVSTPTFTANCSLTPLDGGAGGDAQVLDRPDAAPCPACDPSADGGVGEDARPVDAGLTGIADTGA